MPELPEVETIRKTLLGERAGAPSIRGLTITAALLFWERTLDVPGVEEFGLRIVGQQVKDIGRRGKYMLVRLTDDTLIIHLRMSGDLWVEGQDLSLGQHYRMVLNFDNGSRLVFNDARKFGRVWLVSDPEQVLGKLGPEPFDPALNEQNFYESLRSRRRQLKPLLMDQTFIAGVGNIYADEALYRARLHPLQLSSRVTQGDAARLLESIRAVLQEGIERHGASIDWIYRGGDFQNYFGVYRRTGEPCWNCGTPIARITVGQRGTHFCPTCQKGNDGTA